MGDFASLGLSKPLIDCCFALGWKTPLPIQTSSIPPALNGKVFPLTFYSQEMILSLPRKLGLVKQRHFFYLFCR